MVDPILALLADCEKRQGQEADDNVADGASEEPSKSGAVSTDDGDAKPARTGPAKPTRNGAESGSAPTEGSAAETGDEAPTEQGRDASEMVNTKADG